MISSKRLFFVAVAAVALMAATLVLIIAPANRRRDALQSDSEQKLTTIARLNEFAAGATNITLKIGELHGAIAHLESRLPPARQLNQVVENIWQLAQASSLQGRSLKTSTGKRAGNYFSQEMNFALTGRFQAVGQFAKQIERMPAAVRVDKMTLTRIGGRDGEMQIDITLSVLLQPETTGAAISMANLSVDPIVYPQ